MNTPRRNLLGLALAALLGPATAAAAKKNAALN